MNASPKAASLQRSNEILSPKDLLLSEESEAKPQAPSPWILQNLL